MRVVPRNRSRPNATSSTLHQRHSSRRSSERTIGCGVAVVVGGGAGWGVLAAADVAAAEAGRCSHLPPLAQAVLAAVDGGSVCVRARPCLARGGSGSRRSVGCRATARSAALRGCRARLCLGEQPFLNTPTDCLQWRFQGSGPERASLGRRRGLRRRACRAELVAGAVRGGGDVPRVSYGHEL